MRKIKNYSSFLEALKFLLSQFKTTNKNDDAYFIFIKLLNSL